MATFGRSRDHEPLPRSGLAEGRGWRSTCRAAFKVGLPSRARGAVSHSRHDDGERVTCFVFSRISSPPPESRLRVRRPLIGAPIAAVQATGLQLARRSWSS
jgi:hypothetical protein